MRPAPLAVWLLACSVVLAGCAAPGPGGTPSASPPDGTTTAPPAGGTTTTAPPSTPTPTTPAGNASSGVVVFDHAAGDYPVIDGGLRYPENDSTTPTYYATLVRNDSEAARFDRDALPQKVRRFVDDTDFASAAIVVVQAFPKSSVPDYRVESVTRDGGVVSVHLNDSSSYGTDDITVETVLIRVRDDNGSPRLARITTQDGVAFDTGDGHVTVGRAPDSVLPYRGETERRNLDEPRGVRIANNRDVRVRYTLTVSAWESPPCRESSPPCGAPARQVPIVRRSGTLAPGEEVVFEDLVARVGHYPVSVVATVPGETGTRRLAGSYDWRVDEYYHEAFATITGDGIEMTQAVQ